ncbi:MAG: hypothetical protein ND895_05985 [Pyrinomonadaceae bacterium]|nr:hypothetical protein [Pyrinomonadaceae bacterium]
MINIISSNARSKSGSFQEVKREEREDNIQWLSRNLPTASDQTLLLMVGGRSQSDFRLRIAQSHVRSDLAPSCWSHVMLLDTTGEDLVSTKVIEISLDPAPGFGFPTPDNGVQEGELRRYASPAKYPNIAVLQVPVARAEVDKALGRFKMQRAVLDGVDLIVRWLAFAWGVARSGNPLLDGYGIPSAAMLEIVVGTAGFDLTPGLESRSSCPEAISQAAKYWHEYYEGQNKVALSGSYYSPHLIFEPVKE